MKYLLTYVFLLMVCHCMAGNKVVKMKGETMLSKPIVYENKENLHIKGLGGASIVGEKVVSNWQNDPERPGVLKADLKDAGITDLGKVASRTNRIDLYCNGKRQQVARWPNEGFSIGGKAMGPTEIKNWHAHCTKEGIIEYKDTEIEKWTAEKEPYMHGYWCWDWAEESAIPKFIDTEKHTITFKEPYHNYGYRDNCRFYGYNLLCELDYPGEYYIDRETYILYWMPSKDYTPGSTTTLSIFSGEAAIILKNCRNVTLSNLTIRGMRNKGIIIEGGENVVIRNCELTELGDEAIHLHQGKGHRIEGCHLHELGCAGIVAEGGNRKTLDAYGLVISNNIIEDFSLFKRTYEPAVHFTGVGAEISHNRMENSSSSALRIDGNDVDIIYNQCFNLVKESDDQGGLDSWFDYSIRGIRIMYNHWKNITGGTKVGAAAIRFDDIISGQEVFGNIFEHCGSSLFGAVQIHGGKDNKIHDNLFYDCQAAISYSSWSESTWKTNYERADHQKKLRETDCFSSLYQSRYPELKEDPYSNIHRNYFSNNLTVNAQSLLLRWEKFEGDNNPFIKESNQPLSYYLQPKILKQYGIHPIDFKKIGPQRKH